MVQETFSIDEKDNGKIVKVLFDGVLTESDYLCLQKKIEKSTDEPRLIYRRFIY
jgi:hypothetical protein